MIASPPGHGTLELQKVAGRTVVTRSQASSPLKLLTPRRRHPAAWVYTSTFGGGMVARGATAKLRFVTVVCSGSSVYDHGALLTRPTIMLFGSVLGNATFVVWSSVSDVVAVARKRAIGAWMTMRYDSSVEGCL